MFNKYSTENVWRIKLDYIHRSPLSLTSLFLHFKIKHGAVGVCCQTLVEAEAMVYGGGITDILVSNQVKNEIFIFGGSLESP